MPEPLEQGAPVDMTSAPVEELISDLGQVVDSDVEALLRREFEDLRSAKFNPSQERDEDGKWTDGGGVARATKDRIARAKATHIPSTRAVQNAASKSEKLIARVLQGEDTDDHQPMDVIVKSGNRVIGVEVKTIVSGKNEKLTMHPESLARKEAWVRSNRAVGHTIAVDARGSEPAYYHRKGFGSFRLGSMQRVTLNQLKKLVAA